MSRKFKQNIFLIIGSFILISGYAPTASFSQENIDFRVQNKINRLTMRAESGDAKAQYDLGGMYWDGDGVPQDYVKAVKWMEQAALQGYPPAEDTLGMAYASGMGGKKQNYTTAKEWFEKAAATGDSYGEAHLGRLYYKGTGVNVDYKQARYWLEKSTLQQNGEGECALGYMYKNGRNVEQNKVIALDLFKKSCKHGYSDCCKHYDKLKAFLKYLSA